MGIFKKFINLLKPKPLTGAPSSVQPPDLQSAAGSIPVPPPPPPPAPDPPTHRMKKVRPAPAPGSRRWLKERVEFARDETMCIWRAYFDGCSGEGHKKCDALGRLRRALRLAGRAS